MLIPSASPDRQLPATLVLYDMFSPLPFPRGFITIGDGGDPEEVELYTGSVQFTGDRYTLDPRQTWSVTRGAIARAFYSEVRRMVDLAGLIATDLLIFARDPSPFEHVPEASVRPFEADEEMDSNFSRRVGRLLRLAVEYSGKSPNPLGQMIFRRKFWYASLSSIVTRLHSLPSEIVWLEPAFVPVLAAALREWPSNSAGARRTVVVPYRIRNVSSLPSLIVRTAEFLSAHSTTWSISAYGHIAEFLEIHQEIGDDADRDVRVVFHQQSPTSFFRCVGIGMRMPDPEGGFAIQMTSGEVAHLPSPPWNMGLIL